MSPARMRTFIDSTPFQPFTIVNGDGQEVDVVSRELVLLYPGGRSIHVVAPKFAGAKTEDDFEDHFIDVFLITDVIRPARQRSQKKRSA